MDLEHTRRFKAKMGILPEMLEFIGAVCRDAGLEHPLRRRVELVLEEIFTNTVRHGYGADCDAPIWLHAQGTSQTLCVIYEDEAGAFDPLEHYAKFSQSIDGRPIGGQGLRLVHNLASAVAYRRTGDRNVITLTFGKAPG